MTLNALTIVFGFFHHGVAILAALAFAQLPRAPRALYVYVWLRANILEHSSYSRPTSGKPHFLAHFRVLSPSLGCALRIMNTCLV